MNAIDKFKNRDRKNDTGNDQDDFDRIMNKPAGAKDKKEDKKRKVIDIVREKFQ
jgi:hypothetical protein